MRPERKIRFLPILWAILGFCLMIPASAGAQTPAEEGLNPPPTGSVQAEEDLKKSARTPFAPERKFRYYHGTKGGLHLDHNLLLSDEEIRDYFYPSDREQTAERYLKQQMAPLASRDNQGNVLLSFSLDRLELRIRSVAGQEVWIFRWDAAPQKMSREERGTSP